MIRPLVVLACAFSILLPRAASAKPKLALTEIEGDTSGDLFAAVAKAVEGDELTLLSGKDVNRAVAKLGDPADLTESDLQKLATALEADAIMLGKLDKTGGAKSLKFRFFVNDKLAKGFTVSFKDPRSPKFRTALHDKVVEKIGGADGDDGDSGEDDPGAAGSAKGEPKVKAGGEGDKPKAGEGDKPKAGEGDKAKAEGDKASRTSSARPGDKGARKGKTVASVDRDAGVEARTSSAGERRRSANLIPIRVDLGVSLVQRNFAFDSTVAGNPPKPSLSAGVGARVAAELYPLALSAPQGGLAKVGLAVEYDRTISTDAATMTQKAPVTQSHFGIGLRYRHAFGDTDRSPTLTIGAGYARRQFSPDVSKLSGDAAKAEVAKSAPTSELGAIAPGVDLRYPLNPRFALCAGLRGLLGVAGGPILEGTAYGKASIYGVDAELGLDIVLGAHIALRIAGELAQIRYSFDGNGALTNLDGDAATREVSGLTDRSFGGTATLGILY